MNNRQGLSIVTKGPHAGFVVEVVEHTRVFGQQGWRIRLLGKHNDELYGGMLWIMLDDNMRPVSGLYDPTAPIIQFKKSRKWSE